MPVSIAIASVLAAAASSLPSVAELNEREWPDISELQPPAASGETVCRDRIHTVREELGLPALGREHADPDQPLFIAAVDHRIDGCSVMVMRNDTSDVRPIPKPDERAPLLRPAQ
jgi:hypothetical protein